ncbi:hypothetical protein V202x_35800 [Gimesia aquarii]|uniref:Uncharacterized protein n=1 Tax=Gimesia aquarii TaxID=2527964 RepID=A0A517WY58_9PLAN|nr:hypothetical protein V202x_35800 [Gimesia aquarii]
MEERRVICRGQTKSRFVSGTVSRASQGTNPSLSDCNRSESEAVGEGVLFFAVCAVVIPKNDRYPLSPYSQKVDFFNTPHRFPVIQKQQQSLSSKQVPLISNSSWLASPMHLFIVLHSICELTNCRMDYARSTVTPV